MDIKQTIENLGKKGIPIPLIRYKGKGSLSATVFVLSTLAVVLGFGFNLATYVYSNFAGCGEPKYFPMTELLAWFGTTSIPYLVRSTGKKDEDDNQQNLA